MHCVDCPNVMIAAVRGVITNVSKIRNGRKKNMKYGAGGKTS